MSRFLFTATDQSDTERLGEMLAQFTPPRDRGGFDRNTWRWEDTPRPRRLVQRWGFRVSRW